jgi:hypothetical protein
MTWVTVSRGMVHPASKFFRRRATQQQQQQRPEVPDYSELVREYLGKWVKLCNVFLIGNALGFAGVWGLEVEGVCR